MTLVEDFKQLHELSRIVYFRFRHLLHCQIKSLNQFIDKVNLILILSCHETIFYDVLYKSIIQVILLYKKTFKKDRKTGNKTLRFSSGPRMSIFQKGTFKMKANTSKLGKVVSKRSSAIFKKSKRGMKGVKIKMNVGAKSSGGKGKYMRKSRKRNLNINTNMSMNTKVSMPFVDSVRLSKRKTKMTRGRLHANENVASTSITDTESRNEQISLYGSDHDGERDDHDLHEHEDFLPSEKIKNSASFHQDTESADKNTLQQIKMKRYMHHKYTKEVPVYATPAGVDIVIYDEAKLLKNLVLVGIGGILASPLMHFLLIGLLPLWLTLFVIVGPFVILIILLGTFTIAFFQSLDEFYVEQFRQVKSKSKQEPRDIHLLDCPFLADNGEAI
uniref:Uncharacterized protein n=1 Tax=Chaetoceros debilis TaxID=122233 RepID=A0A7S3Q5M1_9STRA